MHKFKVAILAAVGTIATAACGGHEQTPPPDDVYVANVYDIMARFGRTDSASRAALVGADTAEVRAFMSVVGELPVTDERMAAWSYSLPVLKFTPLADSVFPDSTARPALAIGNMQARLRRAGVAITPRRYAIVVWGRLESIMFVDSVMLIALNHYLGAENEAYEGFPLYQRLVKEPKYMPYDITEAVLATDHPYDNEGGTVLQRMLYEGALTVAKIEAVDGGNAQDALGYRPEQMQFIIDEEAALWRQLIAQGYLFDTSQATIDRLINPAPNTPLLDIRCPGRVGRYIGYRIVESYRSRHPEVTLSTLLSPQFYADPTVLEESHYNP